MIFIIIIYNKICLSLVTFTGCTKPALLLFFKQSVTQLTTLQHVNKCIFFGTENRATMLIIIEKVK
jgi:hypothetical protein